MILGIAGKACSGKNAAASLFEKKGFLSIDVDTLGHLALNEKKQDVADRFGEDLLKTDGHIDRKKLGDIVFNNRTRLNSLEEILHPVIIKMVEKIIRESDNKDIIINAAILGTSGMDKLCDKVLWIESPLFMRIKRAFTRDKYKISHIFSRIRSQRDLTVQHFSTGVDIYMVRNGGSLTNLEKQIDLFLQTPENYKRV